MICCFCWPEFPVLFIATSVILHFCVQSLLRLKEPAVLLRCREHDQHLVLSVLESAKEEYAEKLSVHPPEIILDTDVFLPPPPSHNNAHGPSW